MNKQEKTIIIDRLAEQILNTPHFYLTDISDLGAVDTSDLRRECFKNNIRLVVVKNKLLKRALLKSGLPVQEMLDSLTYSTSVMFTEDASAPAKLIKKIRQQKSKPILKAAFVEEYVYIGDDQLENLVNVKSKNELVGELVALLQSPMKTVLSQLMSGKHLLGGLMKTLSDRENK